MQSSLPNTAPAEPVTGNRRKPRRRKPTRAEIENDLLEQPRWSGLRQQQHLQSRNHSELENNPAHRRCRQLVEGGWGSIDWRA